MTSNGFGFADPPAGSRALFALVRVCFATRSPALGRSKIIFLLAPVPSHLERSSLAKRPSARPRNGSFDRVTKVTAKASLSRFLRGEEGRESGSSESSSRLRAGLGNRPVTANIGTIRAPRRPSGAATHPAARRLAAMRAGRAAIAEATNQKPLRSVMCMSVSLHLLADPIVRPCDARIVQLAPQVASKSLTISADSAV